MHLSATKYILNDYVSDYKTRLIIKLNLLPLMYIYDQCDILAALHQITSKSIRSFRYPDLHQILSSFYYVGLLPVTNLNMFSHYLINKETSTPTDFLELSTAYQQLLNSTFTTKFQLTKFLWQHFMRNFDPDNQHA